MTPRGSSKSGSHKTTCTERCDPCGWALALLILVVAFSAVWVASDKGLVKVGAAHEPSSAPLVKAATEARSEGLEGTEEPPRAGQLQWPSTPLSVTLLPKKDFVDENGMALAALFVAILSAIASVSVPAWLAKRARRSSVNDDFWVRQVAFPNVVIEGMRFMNEASVDLESMQPNHLDAFLPRWQEQKQRLQMLPAMLGNSIATQEAFQAMSESLDSVQDVISTYSYSAAQPLNDVTRARVLVETRKVIVQAQADWCEAMRKWQHKT